MCVETVFLREGGFFFKGASFLSFCAIIRVFWAESVTVKCHLTFFSPLKTL